MKRFPIPEAKRTKCSCCLFILAVLSCMVCPAVVRGDTYNLEGVKVTRFENWPAIEKGGYFPLILQLENTTAKASVVTVKGESRFKIPFEKKVPLEPLEKKLVTLQIGDFSKDPGRNYYWEEYELRISANGADKKIRAGYNVKSGYSSRYSIVFVCRKKPDLIGVFENVFGDRTGYSSREPAIGSMAPRWLPEGWISYSGIDMLVIEAASLGRIPSERHSCLKKWIRMGGKILIYNSEHMTEKVFADVFPYLETEEADDGIRYADYGSGRLCILKGFPGEEAEWMRIRSVYFPTYLHSVSEKTKNIELHIPGVGTIPAKGFLVIIIIFSIIIGPVNIFYLKAKKKDILMLATIPSAAVVAGLLLFLYSNLSEGIKTRMAVASVSELAIEDNSAYTDASFSVYNSTFTKKSFSMSPDCMIKYQRGFLPGSARLGFEGGNITYDNFVAQRIIQSFRSKNASIARERVSVSREGDTVRFLNGLGVDITYAAVNIDGVFYAGTDISEGEKTQLKLSQKHKGPFDLEKYMEDDFDERQKDKILRFMEKCMTAQMQGRNFDPLPGYFIAVAEDNPFIRPDLSGYGLHAGFHIIYGRY